MIQDGHRNIYDVMWRHNDLTNFYSVCIGIAFSVTGLDWITLVLLELSAADIFCHFQFQELKKTRS